MSPAKSTTLIHHGYRAPEGFESPTVPVHKASTVFFPDTAALRSRSWLDKSAYTYGLHGTPTTFTLEARIAELEGGMHALVLPSGLAAITLVDMALLAAGDEVLLPDNAYGPGKAFARHELGHWGIPHAIYDPMDPVPSYGGNVCCTGNAVQGGAFDQRRMEERPDILVYSSEPLPQGLEVSGPIEVTLYVSSDARDTDFTVKLIDLYPDGRAYNLDESIQRMRYRDGYDRPVTWMEKGKVYKVALQPLTTSNYFAPGHRLRIEVSSSNFPRFDRNLNTGGNNYDEVQGIVAHNLVHHSRQYPSQLTVTVVRPQVRAERP